MYILSKIDYLPPSPLYEWQESTHTAMHEGHRGCDSWAKGGFPQSRQSASTPLHCGPGRKAGLVGWGHRVLVLVVLMCGEYLWDPWSTLAPVDLTRTSRIRRSFTGFWTSDCWIRGLVGREGWPHRLTSTPGWRYKLPFTSKLVMFDLLIDC